MTNTCSAAVRHPGPPGGVPAHVLLALLAMTMLRAAETPNTGMADPAALIQAFDGYRGRLAGGGRTLTIPLVSMRGLTTADNAGGSVNLTTTPTITTRDAISIDMAAGSVDSTVNLLPLRPSFDLWLVDNRVSPGHTTFAEATANERDVLKKVGTYHVEGTSLRLTVNLGANAFQDFFPDRAFVVELNRSPIDSFVLTGSPTIFDRLLHRQVRYLDGRGVPVPFDPTGPTRELDFARLIAQGRQLFLKEKFNGNGRTCGTCHVETNNFTIDPDFISTLPPTDPLFVAQTSQALATLENSELLHKLGLILVNADGFQRDRGFVLRSVQNLQALKTSIVPQDPNFFVDFSTNGKNPNPPERTGWGNDGAPMRDFALVAIVQHATKTLNRARGIDFRLPTDEELDALVAYQLSLGRQEDFTLSKLELKSTIASQGKALFLDTGNLLEAGHKNCNGCHFNAGATAGMSFNARTPGFPKLDGSHVEDGFNSAFATNVNETDLAKALGSNLPRDGGFGQIPTKFRSFGNTDDLGPPFGHLEIEEFNSPSVVESADTGPFFHNHTVKTLEEAVAFYGTDAFKSSLIAFPIPVSISGNVNNPEVQAIAAFLRVLNALENIRSSINIATRGRRMEIDADARDLASLAIAETADAIRVLSEGALAKSFELGILSARANLFAARISLDAASRLGVRRPIDLALDQAIVNLRGARSALVNKETLPPSFRN